MTGEAASVPGKERADVERLYPRRDGARHLQAVEESGRYFCEIPELQGVWADGDTPEAGLAELQEVLEDWIALGLAGHQRFPALDGIDITTEHATGARR